MATSRECPSCHEPGLRIHCGNPFCTWALCASCGIQYDVNTRLGYGRDGKRYRIVERPST